MRIRQVKNATKLVFLANIQPFKGDKVENSCTVVALMGFLTMVLLRA